MRNILWFSEENVSKFLNLNPQQVDRIKVSLVLLCHLAIIESNLLCAKPEGMLFRKSHDTKTKRDTNVNDFTFFKKIIQTLILI